MMIDNLCIRIDLNIPLTVEHHPKINTLKKICQHYAPLAAKIYLCSHLGQPKGFDKSLSFSAIVQLLREKHALHISLKKDFKKEKKPGIYLCENLRFDIREQNNCPTLANDLLSMSDMVFFEALACSHRSHASVERLMQSPKSQLGHFAKNELNVWRQIKNSNECLF